VNRLEQIVHKSLKDNVALKNNVKWAYQRMMSLLPGPRVDTELDLTVRPNTFFGFHDKSPWSPDGHLLLGHTFEGDGTGEQWARGASIGISVFSGSDWTKQTRVAQTRAWNWQQGAQLQWLGDGQRLVYNDFRDGTCVGVVRDLDGDSERELDSAVSAVAPGGDYYVSICFDTLGRAMPGYGYAFRETGASSSIPPRELLVQSVNGSVTISITEDDLPADLPPASGGDEVTFFSHCLFSPDGTHLLFLRRRSAPNRRLRSEMFCVDLKRRRIQRMDLGDMVSHFTWMGKDAVLVYASTDPGGEGFYMADPTTGEVIDRMSHFNNRDGHPHATPGGEQVVFDTYPDGRRYQRLFGWEEEEKQAHLLARIYTPLKFWGTSRVDLHPRIRSDGQYLSFDAGSGGVRSLITAEMPSEHRK
jgi:hypothetical protein